MQKNFLGLENSLASAGWKVLKNGWPDYLCVADGKAIVIEAKSHNERLRPEQRSRLAWLASRGIPAYVAEPSRIWRVTAKGELKPANATKIGTQILSCSVGMRQPRTLNLRTKAVIRDLKTTDLTMTEIARKYGISRQRVHQIRNSVLVPLR